jgi:mono/diheme cytochrome c family protein
MKKLLITGLAALAAATLCVRAGDAKDQYEQSCTKCHGSDGKGDTKMGKKLAVRDYSDAKVQADLKDDAAFKSLKEGLKDADGKVQMKPFADLSDGDIKALVAYMRTFKK